ncbi:MAG: hypothetical protein H7267_00495 [Sandarakinorhabdus sp.]|nr:hypothetical protein [Sandarakinorhabdus sp.]
MTDGIDQALRMLGEAAVPDRLCDLEQGVMARIDAAARAREARPSLGVGVGAAVAAMVIGLATVQMTPVAEKVPLEVSVFSVNAALAPATLLATRG